MEGKPGNLLNRLFEDQMLGLAPSRDELRELLAETHGDEPLDIICVDQILEGWRSAYRELLGDWPE